MKVFKNIILFILLFFIWNNSLFAEETYTGSSKIKIIESELKNLNFSKNNQVWDSIIYDLSNIEKRLLKEYWSKIEFEWSLKWATTKKWSIFERKFSTSWEKSINLNIYHKKDKEKKLIINKIFSIFIYNKKVPVIFDSEIWEERIEKYIDKSIESWVFIDKSLIIDIKKIEQINLLKDINENFILKTEEWNYVTVWWTKEFIFSIVSNLNKQHLLSKSEENINLVLVSPFSTDVLNNYLRNFLSNKNWIKNIILIPESSMSQLRLNSDNISKLEISLNNKEYENLNINTTQKISELLLVSKFVNTLSNNGFLTNSIYLILIIPFLFTLISIFKHFIGLSPVWIIIPIFITLLLFLVWIITTLTILIIIILFNLAISKIVNKYTLLYTPKISFIIIMNIIVLIFSINTFYHYNLINLGISDIIFIILFIIISERLISLVISKEFSEYKYNLLNTIIFGLFAYLLFSVSIINTLILAYPELILLLVPLNFLIWRFTWLRITEYFRFKDVIKSIEE